MTTDYTTFVDQTILSAANNAIATAKDNLTTAQTNLASAQTALAAAQAASDAAINGNGQDPIEAEAALEAAQRSANVAAKIVAAKQTALKQAHEDLKYQTGLAWVPVVRQATADLVAASQAADAARAAKAAARAQWNAAAKAIGQAQAHGVQAYVPGNLVATSPSIAGAAEQHVIPTAAEMTARLPQS
jgi:hypothetical protein